MNNYAKELEGEGEGIGSNGIRGKDIDGEGKGD